MLNTVGWFCAVTIVFLIAGTVYNFLSGNVSIGSFSFLRKNEPILFYLTLTVIFIIVGGLSGYLWIKYGFVLR